MNTVRIHSLAVGNMGVDLPLPQTDLITQERNYYWVSCGSTAFDFFKGIYMLFSAMDGETLSSSMAIERLVVVVPSCK